MREHVWSLPQNVSVPSTDFFQKRLLHNLFIGILYLQVVDLDIDGLVQEIRDSIAKALGLRLSCTNPSMPRYNVSGASLR